MNSTDRNDRLRIEAEAFAKYLTGEKVSWLACDLYIRLHGQDTLVVSHGEDRLLDLCIRHPFLIGLIDNGTGVFRRDSSIRKKLHYMSSVLETMPEHAHRFLPQSRSFSYLVWIVFMSGLALVKAIPGYLLLSVFRKGNGQNP